MTRTTPRFLQWSRGTELVLGDGAMGTMLQSRGLPLGEPPERWNVERPEEVIAVHRAYVGAGAAWLQANTFGGTRTRLEPFGLAPKLRAVNRTAVRCARAASGDLPVLASLGPTGDAATEWDRLYAEQCEALAEEGVDGYMVETVVALPEGIAAVRAAAEAGAGVIFAAFTPGADGNLPDGTPAERAAEELLRAGANILGVNCGSGPRSLLPVVARLAALSLAPIFAAPNAGLPEITGGRARYALTADGFALAAIDFQAAGARFFAGCCGTTPEHIQAVRQKLSISTGRVHS